MDGKPASDLMRVLIRADSSTSIGTGHVMRCLALATTLRLHGVQVEFVSRALAGHMGDEIRRQGFVLHVLPQGPGPGCDAEQESDAQRTLACMHGRTWDWLLVDHYGLDATWHGLMRSAARQLAVIDDLADRPLDCDLLIDHNLQTPGRYKAVLPDAAMALLGPRYALLRAEFADWRTTGAMRLDQTSPPAACRVLVSLGGADEGGVTLDAVNALATCPQQESLGVMVIAGPRNPYRDALALACERHGYDFISSAANMAERMARADLAIGAGGGSLLERCAVYLPSVVLVIAENQRQGSVLAAAAGVITLIDAAPGERVAAIARAVLHLRSHPAEMAAMARRAGELCDGLGCQRIAQVMQRMALRLRGAQMDDAQALLEWRNAPATRRHSGNGEEIALQAHQAWLARVLADPMRGLWIAEVSGGPVGVVRFDLDGTSVPGGVATISVYLVPGITGRGWGRALIARGVEQARLQWPGLSQVDAVISGDNPASLKAFAACGFQPGQRAGTYHLILESSST
jgi:UDP-2,4-diacetamido-2,4,6-trideoxy-beta-L-altropyranose hydrolase